MGTKLSKQAASGATDPLEMLEGFGVRSGQAFLAGFVALVLSAIIRGTTYRSRHAGGEQRTSSVGSFFSRLGPVLLLVGLALQHRE